MERVCLCGRQGLESVPAYLAFLDLALVGKVLDFLAGGSGNLPTPRPFSHNSPKATIINK